MTSKLKQQIIHWEKIKKELEVFITEEFSESDSNYIVVEHHVVEELQTIDDEEGGGGGENQDDISEGGQRYTTHWTIKQTKE
nr:6823_t:CDS:2 [Entrophospora candida]